MTSVTKILITGGTGFIGRNLVNELLDQGWQGKAVRIVLIARSQQNVPQEWLQKCIIIISDLESLGAHVEHLQGIDYAFHLAGNRRFSAGKRVLNENCKSTEALLNVLKTLPGLRRLVFASSIGAVDRSRNDPCLSPLTEETPLHPTSYYGQSKKACEEMVATSGVPYTIVRIPWCVGEDMMKDSHLRVLIQMVEKHHPISFFNWPGHVTLLEVNNCVHLLLRLSYDPNAESCTFFATDGPPISIGSLFKEIGNITGCRTAFLPIPNFIVKTVRLFRQLIPFQLKSLFLDTLWVDDRQLKVLGYPELKRGNFLYSIFRHQHKEHAVLITGAASGIGQVLAEKCIRCGYSVVLVDKNQPLLDRSLSLSDVHVIVADLSTENGVSSVVEYLQGNNVKWVINCAGIGYRGYVDDTPFDIERNIVGTNIAALTRLSRESIKKFRSNGGGVLVNIASSAAFQPLPGMALYAASKSYVLAFSEALMGEVRGQNITILAVCPGGVDTKFQEVAGVKKNPREHLLSPEKVAQKIICRVQKHRSGTLFVGTRVRIMSWMGRVLPRSVSILVWRRLMEVSR